jgi:hypothetical protein
MLLGGTLVGTALRLKRHTQRRVHPDTSRFPPVRIATKVEFVVEDADVFSNSLNRGNGEYS